MVRIEEQSVGLLTASERQLLAAVAPGTTRMLAMMAMLMMMMVMNSLARIFGGMLPVFIWTPYLFKRPTPR